MFGICVILIRNLILSLIETQIAIRVSRRLKFYIRLSMIVGYQMMVSFEPFYSQSFNYSNMNPLPFLDFPSRKITSILHDSQPTRTSYQLLA